jgi:hypothetical protein
MGETVIEAELHGKSHVAEDRLTSTCLGLLRFLPDSYLLEFLGKAVTLENHSRPATNQHINSEKQCAHRGSSVPR